MDCDEYGASLSLSNMPKGSFNVWSPFPENTNYFSPTKKEYMFNLIVDNLDEMLSQISSSGEKVHEERENGEFGNFGWFIDPEGNKVELWEPNPDFKVSK